MHEMGVIQNVLRITEDAAEKGNAKKILKIHIRMGEYSDVVPEILREYFEIAAKGTVAEGAEIVLSRVPAVMRCRTCHWEGPVKHGHVVCADCGSTDLTLISGREFIVESLEAE